MEHEARFDRIEQTLETLAKAKLRSEYTISDAVEQMARSHKQLLTAQILMADEITNLAKAQEKTESALQETQNSLQETQGKLDTLIHMWDDWIRERESRNGKSNGEPPKP